MVHSYSHHDAEENDKQMSVRIVKYGLSRHFPVSFLVSFPENSRYISCDQQPYGIRVATIWYLVTNHMV